MGSFAVWPVGSSRPASHSTRLRPVGVLTPRRHLPPASGVRPLLDTTWKLPQRHQTRGPSLGKAPARGPWGFSHRGTSRRQTATSTHACFRAGNGEERGWTQHTRNTTTLPFANPQPHRIHPASVRGIVVAYESSKCPFTRFSKLGHCDLITAQYCHFKYMMKMCNFAPFLCSVHVCMQ